MLIIAHRGNLEGPNPETENNPEQIDLTIRKGFMCEIDLWKTPQGLFLGHDEPQYKIDRSWLIKRESKLFVHLKNPEALEVVKYTNILRFAHDRDDFALVNGYYIWTVRENIAKTGWGIWVINARKAEIKDQKEFFGICTDYPLYYQDICQN